jgi:hypothetical protein
MDLAYLDAGSGSQLAMAVVAGFAGTMVAVRMWWRRLLGGVRRLARRSSGAEPAAGSAPGSSDREG